MMIATTILPGWIQREAHHLMEHIGGFMKSH
jgi:hypothetical protein